MHIHQYILSGQFQLACQNLAPEMNVELVDFVNENNDTYLHTAAKVGALDVILRLLNLKADSKRVNNQGQTPAETAYYYEQWGALKLLPEATPLFLMKKKAYLMQAGRELIIEKIREAGLPILNQADEKGRTAYHYANKYKIETIKSLLLEKGVETSFQENAALVELASNNFYNDEFFLNMMKNVSNINHKDAKGRTCLYHAVWNDNVKIARALFEAGADASLVRCFFYSTSFEMDLLLLEKGVICPQENQATITERALKCSHFPSWEKFLTLTGDINRKYEGGNTLLHKCFRNTFYHDKVSDLLARGSDPNSAADDGKTPFSLYLDHLFSFRTWDPELIDKFLEHGANKNERSVNGETIEDICNRFIKDYAPSGTKSLKAVMLKHNK